MITNGDDIRKQSIPVIALLTDFGLDDSYVGAMKGVILSICPTARIIDITHAVQPQNVREAAFVLLSAHTYMPPQTIVVAVVDPGVGSARKPIAVQTDRGFFVGPDNGLFSYVFKHLNVQRVVALQNRQYMLPGVSATFHGRDIFSPAAAHLATGVPIDQLGPALQKLVWLEPPHLEITPDAIIGEVFYEDRFGNLVTSIGRLYWDADDMLELIPFFDPQMGNIQSIRPEKCAVQVRGQSLGPLRFSYANVPPGNIVALINSAGHLEVAVNQGSAAHQLGMTVGESVILRIT